MALEANQGGGHASEQYETKTLSGGENGAAAHLQLSRVSKLPFEEVLAKLRTAIGTAEMRLLHEIDPTAAVAGIGQTIAASRLLFFFHPALVVRVFQMDWTAMVEAPLKLFINEMPDGNVSIRMADPTVTFAQYGNAGLASFGAELKTTSEQIMAAAV